MTAHIPKWQRVSALLYDKNKTAWVTSTEWGEIALELTGYDLTQPGNKPTPKNFTQIKIGNLLLKNSGTEDPEVVDLLNWKEIGEDYNLFTFRRDNFITGKA